jgi:hypothetical protein
MPNPPRLIARFSLADLLFGMVLAALVLAPAAQVSEQTLLFTLPFAASCLISRCGRDGLMAAPLAGILSSEIYEMTMHGHDFAGFASYWMIAAIAGLYFGILGGGTGHFVGVAWRRVVVGRTLSSRADRDSSQPPAPTAKSPPIGHRLFHNREP